MAIAKLGDIPGRYSPLMSPTYNPIGLTVPAGGIPAGSTVIIIGWNGAGASARYPRSVTDPRGNVYTIRANSSGGGSAGCFLIDAQITTALLANDIINIDMGGPDALHATIGAWFSQCFFDQCAQVAASGTAVTAGTITPGAVNELILGWWGGYSGTSQTPPSITTPGAGYTNQTGIGFGGNLPDRRARADDPVITPFGLMSIGMDWESKIGAGTPETATATFNVAQAQAGMTAGYSELPLLTVSGVV